MDGNQISDQIVQAINIIAEKKIEAISFDTTIEATIIDDSRASEGIYMVSNGSASFEAVSTETGYKKNDAVLVTIPQGDYSKQKIIAGKQVNKTDNSPIVYQSPFKTILNMTNNLIGDTSKIGEVGMIANHPNKYCWDVNTKNFTDSIAYTQTYKVEGEDKIVALIWDSEDILSEGEFNHTQIGIKAQFSTWLEEYGVVSGNYGLAVEIFFTHKDDVMSINAGDTNITQDIIDSHSFSKIIYLDSDSFFGNVYNFESYYTQEKIYDISEYTDFPITRIRLFAYQRNNFKDINNNKVKYEEDFNSTDPFGEIMPNIFIKDFYICLGAPIEQFTADSAEIITRQGYNYMQDPPELKIVNKDDIESLSEQINNVLYDENGTSISITQALKPFIRERHNLFYKYLKKVLLKEDYNREKIKDIFNALVASKNNNFKKPIPAEYDWTKNKIQISAGEKQSISDFLNNLLEQDNIVFSNEKTLELRWIHKDDFNEEVNVISSLPENYKIYWFRYKESVAEVENRHSLMDAHWDLLESKQEDDVFKITFNPNVRVGKERIQAIVVREDNGIEHLVVKSNVLELINITETVSTATLTAVTKSLDDLAICFDDGSGGNYFLYNRAKKLFSVEKNEVRTLTAVFDEDEDIVENKKDLEGPCSVKWIIPANNTMIIPWDKQKNCRLDNLTVNKNVYVIEEQLEENDKKSFFAYKINENLDYTKNNNTVILEVKRFDQTYFASATMRFGSAGTSGSDYTVVVNWSNDQAVFDISEANNNSYALSGEVSILDQDGKNIVNDNLNYEYSWYKVKSDDCNFDYAEETNEDLLYPINNNALGRFRVYDEKLQTFRPYPNNEDENKIVTYCYANFLDAGYPSRPQNVSSNQSINGSGDSFMINNGTSNNNEYVYYEYNLFLHDFKELENSTNIKINAPNEVGPRILYAKSNFQERNENESFYIFPSKRYKIQYKPFDNVYNIPFKKNNLQESGVIDIHTDGTIDYYYGSGFTKRKAFIKDKDHFIIDPYDRYYKDLIYYYPTVVENERKYNETTLIIEEDKNKFYIKKDSEKELNIDDLYIFQITITSGLTEYPLIARFPIALKQNLYKNSSGKILTKNELKEEEGEHLFVSTDGFKGATEIRYTTSGEVDFDKTQYSIHLSVWNEENKQIKNEWANQDLQVGKWKINSENEQFSQFDSLINNKKMKQTCIDYLLDKLGQEESGEYLISDKWQNIQKVFALFLSPTDEQNGNKNLIIKYFTDKIYEEYIIKNKSWPSQKVESGFLKSRLENSSDVFLINFIKILEKIGVIIDSNFEILLNETSTLSPSSIYFKNAGLYGIQFVLISDPEDSSNSLTGANQKVLWTQPIYIYQDNYPSTTLNEWGGKEILTDNEKGLIVANGFSAGKKEADNTFTGVVIGDWSKSDTDKAITKQTGIYGFNHGIMSYALKDDGTAFFGADGSGRIYLNGNNAKIYSANWIKASIFNNQSLIGNLYKPNQEGMMLDISNGELLIQKKVGRISIVKDSDINETDYIYTSIQDNRKISLNENGLIISRKGFILNSDGEIEDRGSEKRLFELEMSAIDKNETNENIFYNFKYALRTPDYTYNTIEKDDNGNLTADGKIISGMEINFANQTITAFNTPNFNNFEEDPFKGKSFKLQAGGQWSRPKKGIVGFKIMIDCNSSYILRIGENITSKGLNANFYVKQDGEMFCKSIQINGQTLTCKQNPEDPQNKYYLYLNDKPIEF